MESIDKIHGTFEKRITDAQKSTVSTAVIKRLPRYHRYLGSLFITALETAVLGSENFFSKVP